MLGGAVLHFTNLKCVEFNWCVTTEHADHDLDLAFLRIDFADCTIESLERTVGDTDHFTSFEVDVVFWIFDAHALLDLADFAV